MDTGTLTLADLSVLSFKSLDEVNDILVKYTQMQVPKLNRTLFYQHLTQRRDAFFWKAGEKGLIYFTDICPYVDCEFSLIFWDGRLTKDRLRLCSYVLREAFKDFEVPRISARAVEKNRPIQRFLQDLGFMAEGTKRRGWIDVPGEVYFDLLLFGALPEDVRVL